MQDGNIKVRTENKIIELTNCVEIYLCVVPIRRIRAISSLLSNIPIRTTADMRTIQTSRLTLGWSWAVHLEVDTAAASHLPMYARRRAILV